MICVARGVTIFLPMKRSALFAVVIALFLSVPIGATRIRFGIERTSGGET